MPAATLAEAQSAQRGTVTSTHECSFEYLRLARKSVGEGGRERERERVRNGEERERGGWRRESVRN